ncbi:M91 family zinc metallopeptidase [Sphingobacterium siyangense]|uniref:NleD-like pathogen effector protein (Putative zinc metallopeptidase) n=1 Tax=Sphingobacterium siyangense TaxID=459529 RepID=A0A562M1W1_9SPHI|nr:M91 family zinc metallopeptidase [Sphingobacterium siyangense]TWI13909.1 NleD-like pathogen effector protein (putative zinc metallopeptidase) [Sphingobacterium siyangense]
MYTGNGVKTDKSGNVTGYKGFLGKAFVALNSIGGTKEGASLLGELQGSSNNFIIQNSSNNNFEINPNQREAGYSGQLYSDPDLAMSFASTSASAMEGGAGGVINWNPNGGSVWVLGGKKNNSATANLGHELFHGRDANRGLLDGRSYRGLKYDEWQATYKENQLRTQMGLPLREYYRSQDNNGILSPLAPRILDANNKPIRPGWVTKYW